MGKMFRVANIDKELNHLEFYLRGRLRSTTKMSQVQKKINDRRGHIAYISEGLETYYKYTTSCYAPKPTAENPVAINPALNNEGLLEPSPFIKVPRGKNMLDKNWGSCDYIIAQYKIDETHSHIYYIDSIKFFAYIERGLSTFKNFLDWDVGVPVNTLIEENIITDVDLIDWKAQKYEGIVHSDERFPIDGYFINRWITGDKEYNNTRYFPKFTLTGRADQSKRIRLTTDTGKTFEFPSIENAMKELNVRREAITYLRDGRRTKFFVKHGEKKARIVKVEEVK